MQWNINGCRGKLHKLQELLQEVAPKIIVLQETKILDNKQFQLKNFNMYGRGRTNHGGGLCTAIHESLPSQAVVFDSPLEILVSKVILKKIT